MRILVCGSRDWTDSLPIEAMLRGFWQQYGGYVLIEGCARGADSVACNFNRPGVTHEHFTADWKAHGKAAGPIRNEEMVKADPDIVLAFTDDLSTSRGTSDMVRRAKKAGVPVYVIGRV